MRRPRIDKIILTRPNVPCGRSLGYFPGSLEDKFAPWAAPVAEAIKERIGKAAYDIALKHGELSVLYPMVSLSYVWAMLWSRLHFGEPITKQKVGALVLILGGIVCIGIGGH